jgi:predicted NBD/HSP70 family sugar kinase
MVMKVLVFDIGGTAIKYATMDQQAEFIEKGKVPTPKDSREDFIDAIGTIFDRYKHEIEGIALSLPGRIDSDRGYAYTGGWLTYNDNTNIIDMLQKRCPVPMTVENDGKCAALAEAQFGNLSDCNDGIVVILGTGIGGGIIKDKKLHKGANFIAGEFSAIRTGNGPSNLWALNCGVPSLIDEAASIKGIPSDQIDGKTVFDWANSGDEEVLKVLDDYCYRISEQLFNLQFIYDPEKIAIGGGISAQNLLIELIQKNIQKIDKEIPLDFPSPTVVPCKFRNDSNLIGALSNYYSKFKR